MTISSSLNAGVAGLNANAARLATISDNIANASTYGYKRSDTEFHSMVIDGASGGSAGGVRATNYKLIDERGPLVATSNATDIAVSGRGMVPVTDTTAVEAGGALPMYMMTTASFRPDENGVLTSDTGMVLMGWPASADGTIPAYPRDTVDGLEPVQVDINQFAGDPTTKMSVGVNLPASETEVGASGDTLNLSVEYFGNLGTSETLSVDFTPTVPGVGSSNEWTMVITDSASGGATVGEYTLTFDDSRENGGTLASVTTVSGGAYDATEGTVTINVDGGPIEISIGAPGDPGGLTQLSDTFAPTAITKDGSPVGNLTSVEIDENGFVHAIYDAGFTRTIYQIPLVDVPNPNGLVALDNQAYQISHESGAFFLWDAGDGPTGSVVGYAREESATDVAAELTHLIQTQRAYSSNAKIIQTVDEMLQETTNIKR
ncbi:flagellar hook protein FlgE [Actibacterium lipolyticum]|uniref:Flagellar hook protein FlgE n=1 Tax=Actibacterium lipolyticum TaxID=1524263 RepID=A0A238KWM3_9RHOB|nr:flagellar hook-basal body complex protein [Actibacterium lipolyticum]SMX47244.1 Flagellar hook protein FlgE [Actibacterium lipolyticum]